MEETINGNDSGEEEISDEDVGLSKEPNRDELPLDEEFAEIDWQKENAESDSAPEPEKEPS